MELQERVGLLVRECSQLHRMVNGLMLRQRLAGLVILAGVGLALLGYLCLRFF